MNVNLLGTPTSAGPAVPSISSLPLYLSKVRAGFPSPAHDYVEQSIDLNELCVKHPASTFFVKVEGDSMIDAGIFDGDVLVVDRSLSARHLDVVVAGLNNDFTVKVLSLKPILQLLARNPKYPSITPREHDELTIFGVVTGVIRTLRDT